MDRGMSAMVTSPPVHGLDLARVTLRLGDRWPLTGPKTASSPSPIGKNHSTQDSHVVPHHGTNWAALGLTSQIRRDAVLSESYGRGYRVGGMGGYVHGRSRGSTRFTGGL